jgi:hypothetical protein
MRRVTIPLVIGALVVSASAVLAQSKTVNVAYLRAAITSIGDRTKIRVTAEFDAASGLNIAERLWLRGKGYSRFTIIDPESGATFEDVYCKHGSKVFETLIKATENTLFTFTGERGRGDMREPALFITDVREEYRARRKEEPVAAQGPRSFRVVMTDLASSNRTVLVNVELGKPYNLFGTQLVIEEEPPPDPNSVSVVGE